jgi:hypothetical protein
MGIRLRGALPAFRALAVGLAVSGGVLMQVAVAQGKSSYDSPYGYDKTWNAALRMVRVDMGLKVLEKDDANGYLLFEYRSTDSGAKPTNGSFEFIRTASNKAEDVRVVVQIPQLARYHEQVLLDHLASKMREDYGDPPQARPPPPSAPDAGPDGGDDNN